MKFLLVIFFLFFTNIVYGKSIIDNDLNDYCAGYLGELYWTLDPIEEESVRENIKDFFNENFDEAINLNYNFYYDSKSGQFLTNINNQDLTNFKKTNYPNFEIIILNSYISNFILNNPHGNYCPAFGDECTSSSLDSYFEAAEEFSKSWNSYDDPYQYLNKGFKNNKCFDFLHTNINEDQFLIDLNLLIKILLDK